MSIEYSEFTTSVPKGYELLRSTFIDVMDRMAIGKGRKRHAIYDNQPLEDQDIYKFSHGFRRDQIRKKASELERLRLRDQAGELLDIIAYASVEYDIVMSEMKKNIADRHGGK